jgi:hypothetical protein
MPTPINMNDSKQGQLTACQQQIESAMAELRKILAEAGNRAEISEEDRRSLDADICLASRSAYFDFYTWLILHSTVDPPAAKELDQLFCRALEWMQPGEFRDSVRSRYQDFQLKCDAVGRGILQPSSADF